MTLVGLLRGLDDDVAAIEMNGSPAGAISDRELRSLSHLDQRTVGQFYNGARILGCAYLRAELDLFADRKRLGVLIRNEISLALHRVDDHVKRIAAARQAFV